MQARMKVQHRAARFGHHQLHSGDIIYTEDAEAVALRRRKNTQRVSAEELRHHLEHGHAEPIKGPVIRPDELLEIDADEEETATAPAPSETATPKRGRRKTRR